LNGLNKKIKLVLMTVSVHEAKTRPVAKLVRANAGVKPQLGAMRGEISWKEGWDRTLTSKEAEAFWQGRW
jgi:hypothetical protein